MKQLAFTPDSNQVRCIAMLQEWCGGAHHCPPIHDFGCGVCINRREDLATFDWTRLTELVLLAHRDAIRIEIAASGPGMVKIIAHARRHREEGERPFPSEWHPSLDDLAEQIQKMKAKKP